MEYLLSLLKVTTIVVGFFSLVLVGLPFLIYICRYSSSSASQ